MTEFEKTKPIYKDRRRKTEFRIQRKMENKAKSPAYGRKLEILNPKS